MWAKQSTAATLIVGPILDSTGAEFTTAVIGDLSLSKNGGTLTALASAATLTHVANGQYTLVMTTGNLDTLGRAQITCNKATYQMPAVHLMVVPAMVFDSMILGSDRFDVNVTHIADTSQTAKDLGAQNFPTNFAALGINASGHVSRVTLVDTTTTNSDMRGTDNAALAATALSTAVWTSTIAGRIDVAVSTRLAPLVAGRNISVAATTGAVELDSASVDAIWNEVLTGATHNIAASAGRRLRQLADTVVLVDGECDAASNAGTDSTGTITLAVGTTTACIGQAIRCENQVRYIASYNAGTRVAQLDRPWCVVPDAGDEYVIFNVRNPLVGLASLALAGSTAAVVNDVLEDTGTTLPGLINAIEGGGGSGTGARTVTVTVNDGTNLLQNATVRMTEGVNTFTATTNVSGVAVFNLDDATYTVGVTKSGYSYSGTTLVVNGTETATYSMTVVSITPPTTPGLSAIVVLCLDAAGQPEADVDIDIRIVTVPSGSTNIAYKGSKQTATSNVNGIARFEVVQGSVCEWKRGKADVWSRVTIDSDSVTNVTSVIGSP